MYTKCRSLSITHGSMSSTRTHPVALSSMAPKSCPLNTLDRTASTYLRKSLLSSDSNEQGWLRPWAPSAASSMCVKS